MHEPPPPPFETTLEIRTCPSCVQRRRRAWSLVNDHGESIGSVGAIMDIAPDRVRELVAEESARRELDGFRCDSIPVQLTQAVIANALARDPDLTMGRIAGWLEMPQSDFDRAYLGK